MTTQIAIRVDASRATGTGHVTRCATLAAAFAERGAAVTFYVRLSNLDLSRFIDRSGSTLVTIGHDVTPADEADLLGRGRFDWLVVDHYGLDAEWERAVRPAVGRILVVDDLADRPHDCDAILDQTYGEDGARYEGLLPARCQGLFGSAYALLRPQFAEVRSRGLRPPARETAHIFFGGTDPAGHAPRFAALIAERFADMDLEVVLGESTGAQVGRPSPRIRWHRRVDDMAGLMARCSIAVGTPGVATWERACLGLPAAYLATAPNQLPLLELLTQRGLCQGWGMAEVIADDVFVDRFVAFVEDRKARAEFRAAGLAAVDGRGAGRVLDALGVL